MNRIAFIAAVAALILSPAASAAQADKPAADKAAPAAKVEKSAPGAKPEAMPQKEAAKPAPEKDAAKSASTPVSAPASTPISAPAPDTVAMADKPKRPTRANEDARKCLELATNPEIAKCAEAFR
jgi:hypothetical protein